MPQDKKNLIGGALAIISMIVFAFIMFVLMFHDLPVGNKDPFNTGLIALIGFVSAAFGFFLGSSYGSLLKTQQNGGVTDETPSK